MKLFEHQKSGIEFLKKTKKGILADEMGLGKTLQAITAAQDSATATLVVCPASLKINWKREILAAYPDADVRILSTTEPNPALARGSWYIVNYDILEKKMESFIRPGVDADIIDTLILDEAHYIKGKSKRAAALIGGRSKSKATGEKTKHDGITADMKQVYLLTGSPLLNRPIEMFNLLRAIGHNLGSNRSWFAKRYCGAYFKQIFRRGRPPFGYVDESGATNLPELARLIEGNFLRRKKKEVLNLPPKIVSVMECELTPEWQKRYDTAWTNYLEFLKQSPEADEDGFEEKLDNVQMARQLVEINKLKQVCSQSKVDRMAADIRNATAQEQKVIVFSQYTETIRLLKEAVGGTVKGEERIGVVTLTGADDMNERQKAVDAFQRDIHTQVIILNIKAGGVGLTLTEGSIVMFADMEWSPEIHKQAEDRAHRIGQEGTVNVYYYIATDTMEEDIVRILNAKKDIMDQLLEGKKPKGHAESMQEAFLRLMAKKRGVGTSR